MISVCEGEHIFDGGGYRVYAKIGEEDPWPITARDDASHKEKIMRRLSVVFGVIVLLFALPVMCDEVGTYADSAQCSPVGTWIGGSDPASPYMMTVTRGRNSGFTAIFQLAAPSVFEPYLGISAWSGELVRIAPGRYEVWCILFAVWDPVWALANGIDPSLPELHMVHSWIEFTDCNTVTNKIDVYNGYLNFDFTKGMMPFVSPPDWIGLEDGVTIDEVYYRMPTNELRSSRTPPVWNRPDGAVTIDPFESRMPTSSERAFLHKEGTLLRGPVTRSSWR